MDAIKKVSDMSETKEKTWSQTTRVGDTTKEVRVEKLFTKGYLVEYRVYGNDSKGEWHEESIKDFSETNPLEESEAPTMDDVLEKLKGNAEGVL